MVNPFTASTVMANFEKEFAYMEKHHKTDGLFGTVTTWEEGVHFWAVERHDQTIEAQQAEQQGTASTYTLYVDKSVDLQAFDHIKRIEDGQTYQVTTNATDKASPVESGMNLCTVQCKKVVLE